MFFFSFNPSLRTAIAAVAVLTIASNAHAQKTYGPGASDSEIKIGNFVPYSGPVSAYGTIGKAAGAYFDKINDEGGIAGRKIKYISVDDEYNPAKSVEQARKLVERDQVLLIFLPLGTAHNSAIQKYMNTKKVPQLFVASGATRWGDPKAFPWTMGWQPTYQAEGLAYAKHILSTKPDAKIAILSQNDDFGRDFLKGVMDGLADKAKTMIVSQATYETSDPTIDSQVVSLKESGANVLINLSTPKFAAQAIKKVAQIDWKPTHYIASVSFSVSSVFQPAGPENAVGIISSTYMRDPSEPRWQSTPEYADYQAFMKKYYSAGNVNDSLNVIGYSSAQTLVQVLKQCGDNLTRENVMKEAANLSMTLPMLYPGIEVKTSADDFYPIEKLQLMRFNGKNFEPI